MTRTDPRTSPETEPARVGPTIVVRDADKLTPQTTFQENPNVTGNPKRFRLEHKFHPTRDPYPTPFVGCPA